MAEPDGGAGARRLDAARAFIWRLRDWLLRRLRAGLIRVVARADRFSDRSRRPFVTALGPPCRALSCLLLERAWLDEQAHAVEVLAAPRSITAAQPCRFDAPDPRRAVRTLPAVHRLELRDVRVSAQSSSFIRGNSLVVERAMLDDDRRGEYRTSEVPFVGEHLALARRRPAVGIDAGLFLAGNGSYNYYHFVIECLARLFYVPGADKHLPLLTAEAALRVPQYEEALRLLQPDAEVITMTPSLNYQIGRLVWITQPSNTPFNLADGCVPRPEDSYFDEQSLGWLRQRALAAVARAAMPVGPRRIFLGRRSQKRQYNSQEITELVERAGFTTVFTEELSFLEQVNLFHSADVIVGPTGAAWTNLLFAKPGARALYWIWSDYEGFSPWASIGGMWDVDVRYLSYQRNPGGRVDTASYHLEPLQFSRALDRWTAGPV